MATSFTTHSTGQVITAADVNLIQTAVNTLENAPAATPTGMYLPSDQGFMAWSYDPNMLGAGATVNSGVMYTTVLDIPAGTVGKIYAVLVNPVASSLTNVYAALYDSTGVFLKQSNDQAAFCLTAAGNGGKVITFTLTSGQVVTAGKYIVGLWVNGANQPTFGRSNPSALIAAGINFGLTTPLMRHGTTGSSLTTVAPTPMGTVTAALNTPWFAVGA